MKDWKRKSTQFAWKEVTKEGVPYLSSTVLESIDGLVQGFSTRLGGVSEGDLSSMNLSFSRGDKKESVEENFRRISKAMGFSPEQMVFSAQTHTTNVRVVTKEDRGTGFLFPVKWEDVDGLVTDQEDVVLVTFYADCVPLYLVDPVKRVIGLSHSGWKGTVGKMGYATVQTMVREFGCDPADLFAVIGPSICQDCYEVSSDVIEEIKKAFPRDTWQKLFYEKTDGKFQLNLWEANRQVFLMSGIPEEQITLPDLCTCCNPTLLFSHRASHGKRGNLAAFLGLTRPCIRDAAPEDAGELVEIYRPYVENTAITFEYDTPSTEEFRGRIQNIQKEFPYLVYEKDGEILGYAYASKFHGRAAYQWAAELSIYLREDQKGKGIGKKLYQKLMERLKKQGILKVYAHITWPNEASIFFHKSMGFRMTARFEKSGYKLGKWRDTVFMERLLAPLPDQPKERWTRNQ